MRGLYKAYDWFGGDSKGISLDYGRILRSREEGVPGHFTPVRPTDGDMFKVPISSCVTPVPLLSEDLTDPCGAEEVEGH